MKKVALFLFLILTLSFAGGCNNPTSINDNFSTAGDVITEYDSTSRIIFEASKNDETEQETTFDETQNHIRGLFIKEKKYSYESNNVVILNVTNETTNNYEVTITMTFYSNKGEKLNTQTQTYNDIAAQHSTYFLFQPNIPFDSYKYEVSTSLYKGECYLSNIESGSWNSDTAIFNIYNTPINELDRQGDNTFYYALFSNFQLKNNNKVKLYIRTIAVSINSNDEIAYIADGGDKPIEPNEIINRSTLFHYQLEEFSLDRNTWPIELKGNLKLLIIPYSVLTEEQFNNR